MPITLENISARPSRQTLKIKGIGTRDTMQYLSALGGTYQDAIFNEQTSNLPDEYIRLDEMARDEKQYNLNIYEFFFEPTPELICEEIKTTLDFHYLNSPTFRRLVNYKVDYIINNDIDTNKCEVKISPNYSYENAEGGRGYLSMPFDINGFPIAPDFYNCENKITSEKLLLDLFLKHILHGDLNSNNEVTCIFSNVIYKEIDPAAIAHTLLCFSPVKVNSEHELFNIDSITALPKSTEQIIYEGNEIQKRILSSFHGSNNFQPGAVHKIERNIKSIAVTSLLLSSRVTAMPDSAEIKDKYTKPDGNLPLYKEQQRYPRALPEDHPAQQPERDYVGEIFYNHGGLANQVLSVLSSVREDLYVKGYHELLVFSQTGKWPQNGREIASEYMLEKIRNYIEKGATITLHNGRLITFYQFIIDRLERQYEMFEVLARDMVVHPETKESGHYLHHLKRKFITPHTPSFEKLYGRDVISRVLEDINLYRKTTRKSKLLNHRQMRTLFKIALLVIHHLSRNGGDMKLLEHNIRKQNYVIILTILQKSMNLKNSGSVKDRNIKRISRNIMVNNKLTRHIEEVIRNNGNGIQLRLMKLAIHKQLDWVEKHYKSEEHIKKHMEECDILGTFYMNKMVKSAVTSFIHEAQDISASIWLTTEQKHIQQVQALERFKSKVSSMNDGQQFVYGFNKLIQEGLGGLIELSFDIDDSRHHRTKSSLSPASREGLHLLGTIWNIATSIFPGFNALAGTSSILNRAIVEKSSDVCGYIQDVIRIGMEAAPVAEAKFTERASNAKYTGLRFLENKIERGVIRSPIQKGSNYKVIESIENIDFIYQKSTNKILELNPEGNDGLYRATGFNKETHGYYKQSGEGFYRKQKSFSPLSTEAPNTIKYGEREIFLSKEPGSETYQGTFSDTGKNVGMTFYRTSDGKFYQASGLKGGGPIRHVDKPYSELREGDVGYDEDLLDISDDSPLLEDMLPSLSEELYPTSEENVQSIYKKLQSGDTAAGETEVVLCRGTTGPQAENIVKLKTAGGVEGADPNVLPVSEETARLQVRNG
ncbi:DUF4765 family protein, partial [Salmonella enterica]|nr:DUF4765 family protein [Salmonella enterica]